MSRLLGVEHPASEKPTSGKVFISDIDITRLPINERADLGISYLAQEASIFRKLTVEDNLRAILQTRNLSKKEQDKKIKELELELTNMKKMLEQVINEVPQNNIDKVSLFQALIDNEVDDKTAQKILEDIVESTKERVETNKKRHSIYELKEKAFAMPIDQSFPFKKALEKDVWNFEHQALDSLKDFLKLFQ